MSRFPALPPTPQTPKAVLLALFCLGLPLLVLGCRGGGGEKGQRFDRADHGEGRDLDRVGDDAEAIPFGQALVLSREETSLLYPTLVAWGAPAEELGRALPERLGTFEREQLIAGVQEAETSAWMGAMGVYQGPTGRVSVLIQDTVWEPTLLNPFIQEWREGSEGQLPDGRPIARIEATDRGGRFLQVPAVSLAEPRLVLQLAATNGQSDAILEELAAAIPQAQLRALSESTANQSGPYPRSPLLPGENELSILSPPKSLLAGLPPSLEGGTLRAEGWGYQREPEQDLVSAAIRTFSTPAGMVQFSIQDLGDPEQRVVVGSEGEGEGSAAWLRKALGSRSKSKTRCSHDQGLCKWAAMKGDRWVLSLSGPAALDGKPLRTLAKAFEKRAKALTN